MKIASSGRGELMNKCRKMKNVHLIMNEGAKMFERKYDLMSTKLLWMQMIVRIHVVITAFSQISTVDGSS